MYMIVVLMQSQVLINCSQFIEINYQDVEFSKKYSRHIII